MNYNDDGTVKQITVKAGDTLPVGTEVDVPDGTTIPAGWVEVNEYEDYSSLISSYMKTGFSAYSDGSSIYKIGKLVTLTLNFGGSISANTDTVIATLPETLRPKTLMVGNAICHNNGNNISAARLVMYTNGNIDIRCSTALPQGMLTITYITN